MTTTVTAPNYSDKEIVKLTEVYSNASNDGERKTAVESLATDMGRKVASIRSKLVAMGIYVKPAKVNKAGVTSVRKDAILAKIAESAEIDEEKISSLISGTKIALQAILNSIEAKNKLIDELDSELG